MKGSEKECEGDVRRIINEEKCCKKEQEDDGEGGEGKGEAKKKVRKEKKGKRIDRRKRSDWRTKNRGGKLV